MKITTILIVLFAFSIDVDPFNCNMYYGTYSGETATIKHKNLTIATYKDGIDSAYLNDDNIPFIIFSDVTISDFQVSVLRKRINNNSLNFVGDVTARYDSLGFALVKSWSGIGPNQASIYKSLIDSLNNEPTQLYLKVQ